MSTEHQDVDERCEQLLERIQQLRDDCLYRSATRVARELRRLAKSEQRLIPYLLANFYLMNDAQSLLDPALGVEVAVDTIALLQSEEQARRLQPDFPEDDWRRYVAWMSSCSYDNLAKHTAERDGYNSDGVHDCINDGLQVCRSTGKLECITCFREYATDVYRAADDVDMALHYARSVAAHPRNDEDFDRRWVGVRDTVHLHLLEGRIEAAREAAVRALARADCYHNVQAAQIESVVRLEEVLLLEGRPEDLPGILETEGVDPSAFPDLPDDEYVDQMLREAYRDATAACCDGDFHTAAESLARWDRRLTEQKCLDQWFETRLRLISVHRLTGDDDRMHALARELETRAKPARDWLTLRRLKGILDGTAHPSPIAALQSLSTGPFSPADRPASATVSSTAPATAEPASDATNGESSVDDDPPAGPLGPALDAFAQRLQQSAGDEAVLGKLFHELVAINPDDVSHEYDAARLVYLVHLTCRFVQPDPHEIWAWAEPFGTKFPQSAVTLNVLADTADTLRFLVELNEGDPDSILPHERIERMFRESLDLEPDRAKNFGRAGQYFLSRGDAGEAERCLARGFRLDRANGEIACQLAEIYNNTDRSRDGLQALDMCLRAGCEDPRVFWQAGLAALAVDNYESALTCLSGFDERVPDEPWTQYYRAHALLELERFDEMRAALDNESAVNPDASLAVNMLRVCAAAGLDDRDGIRAALEEVFKRPLRNEESLNSTGLARLFEKAIDAADLLPPNDARRVRLERLALATGMAPNSFFDRLRRQNETVGGLGFFVVEVAQPLDERWSTHEGRLAGQEDWKQYICRWGVLAQNEFEAVESAMHWQEMCYPLRPISNGAMRTDDEEKFEDHPGVVWQSLHEAADDDDD